MLETLRRQMAKDEKGFTLIELMVVVLIIAILIAIAIPTFLGAQDRARDRAAQSDLRNAMTAVRTISTDDAGLFTNVDAANLDLAEGALAYGAADGTDGDEDTVGWDVDLTTDPQIVRLSKVSDSGTAFAVNMTSDGAVTYCSSDDVADIADTADACADAEW